jgi:putative transposase
MLREQEAGVKTADVCRKYGIGIATFYRWKAKYGGLEVSDAKRLKAIEDENAKLKRLLAEAELDRRAQPWGSERRTTTPSGRTVRSAICRPPSLPNSAFPECNGTDRSNVVEVDLGSDAFA